MRNFLLQTQVKEKTEQMLGLVQLFSKSRSAKLYNIQKNFVWDQCVVLSEKKVTKKNPAKRCLVLLNIEKSPLKNVIYTLCTIWYHSKIQLI